MAFRRRRGRGRRRMVRMRRGGRRRIRGRRAMRSLRRGIRIGFRM